MMACSLAPPAGSPGTLPVRGARQGCAFHINAPDHGGALRAYMSVTDIQRELGLTAGQVQELIGSGRLPAFRILGRWRIERELLERMIDELYEEPAGPAGGSEPAGRAAPADQARPCPAARPPLGTLTGQQQRILELIGQGLSNAEIAASLTVEVSTVKSHVSRILQRGAFRDREQLIAHAWQSGLMAGGSTPTGTDAPG